MAKKKPKKENSRRKAIAAAVAAAGMSSIPERELAHIRKVLAVNVEADQAYAAYRAKRSEAKQLKENAQLLYDQVHAMLRAGPEAPALFDKHSEGEAAPEVAGDSLLWSEQAAAFTDPKQSEPAVDWKAEPLDNLRPPKGKADRNLTKAINALAKAEIVTVGQFEDLRAKSFNGNWFEAVKGLGREAADAIENAVIDWLAKFHNGAKVAEKLLDRKEQADGAAGLASSLIDWQRAAVVYVLDNGDYPESITATILRKFLRSTSCKDEANGLEFHCDGSGIHVTKCGGQPLAAGSTLGYPEAVKLMKAIWKEKDDAEAAAAAADIEKFEAEKSAKAPAAAGELPEDWQRFIVGKLQVRAQYFELPTAKELKDDCCPGGYSEPGPEGHAVVFLSEGIHVNSVRGVECDKVITWADAARLLKQLIAEKKGGEAA